MESEVEIVEEFVYAGHSLRLLLGSEPGRGVDRLIAVAGQRARYRVGIARVGAHEYYRMVVGRTHRRHRQRKQACVAILHCAGYGRGAELLGATGHEQLAPVGMLGQKSLKLVGCREVAGKIVAEKSLRQFAHIPLFDVGKISVACKFMENPAIPAVRRC